MAAVARAAGVSVSTVSHVVNKTRPIAPETERTVLAALAELGYVPDNIVRSMRTAGSASVGLAMSAISNPYFGDVVHSIEQAVSRVGHTLLLADTHDDVVTELRAVSDLLTRHVGAIILAPSADPSGALRHAAQRKVPVVLIDRLLDVELDQIATESVESTATLVDHLAQVTGHTRIAMISGRRGLATTEDRIAGYLDGMRRNNLPALPEYLVSGDSTDAGAAEAFATLLALATPPTALVVGNNRMTIGAMRGARSAGVRIPQDLALVAFDDFDWADLFHPRLTVIAQPTHALGTQAAELVFSRLDNPDSPVRQVVMRPTFMHRDSCGC